MKNFKRMFAICVSGILALASMTACGSSASKDADTSSVVVTTQVTSSLKTESFEIETVANVETKYWNPHSIELDKDEQEYIDQVNRRLKYDQFYTDEELKWLEEHDYTVDENGYSLHYGEDGYVAYAIPYTSSDGEIYRWRAVGYHGDLTEADYPSSGGVLEAVNIHVKSLDGVYRIITDGADSSLVYCPYTGEVKRFRLGDELDSAIIGKGVSLEYAGYNKWFDEDIFLTEDHEIWLMNEETLRSRFLVGEVDKIVVTDYYLNSDMFSEILAIMTDGSIKVVLLHNGQLEEPSFVDGQVN